jgi:hypothetical protein
MRSDGRHPRLTALKSLALLRRLERDPSPSTIGDVKEALAEHVAAELVKKRRSRSASR